MTKKNLMPIYFLFKFQEPNLAIVTIEKLCIISCIVLINSSRSEFFMNGTLKWHKSHVRFFGTFFVCVFFSLICFRLKILSLSQHNSFFVLELEPNFYISFLFLLPHFVDFILYILPGREIFTWKNVIRMPLNNVLRLKKVKEITEDSFK